MSTQPARLTRRAFVLQGTWGALAVASVGILAACSTGGPAATTSGGTAAPVSAAPTTTGAAATNSQPTATGGKLQLPTYVPPAGPAPDVPGTDVIPPGFVNYPKSPTQSVANPPGDGSTVTVAGETFTALIPVDQNTLWQQLNKSLNVNLQLNLAPFADWAFGKFQALVAGGDLPDITMIPIGGVIPDLPSFLEAKVQDLTPFVSGDAVKDYPNLAALPTIGWKGMVYNNKIFAVPIAQSQFYWGLWGHLEELQAKGLSWPKTAADFRQTLKTMTNLQANTYGIGLEVGNRYAFGNTNVGGQLWPAIFNAPNNWGISSDGKWTKDWETDQFKAGIQLAQQVWADSSFSPDTTLTTPSADDAFEGGKFAFRFTNALNYNVYDAGAAPVHRITTTQNPPWQVRLAPPIAADANSKGQYNYGIGNFGLIVLKKASSDRIKLLLKCIDYICAPFGSQEYLTVNYGVQGQDYALDENGNPRRTAQGVSNNILWNGVMGLPPPVLFDPQLGSFPKDMNAALQQLAAVGVQDPTVGLYSATNQKQGFLIQSQLADGFIDIIVGRRPMSDYDGLVSTWRSAGGDQIRQEFQQAYAQSKS